MSISTPFLHEDTKEIAGRLEIPPAPQIELADLIIAYLEQIGVEYVFGVPGGAIEPLYNALGRSARRGGIRPIVSRHEAGAAYMADGYARETGKIGVCCSTTGPGATNLITGVACAYDDNIPMLVITGQSALPFFGRHAAQESACTGVNILGMFQHCTRYNSLVSHPKQLESKLIAALQRATRTPYGPAHLAIPVDILRSISPQQTPSYNLNTFLAPSALMDGDAFDRLCQVLSESKKIVLLIGAGCGEAIGSILQFAILKGATFIATPDSKGLTSPHHSHFRGVFGCGGHDSAEAALRDESVDLILAIGTSMGEMNSNGWSSSLLNERLVHIDESEDHLSRTPMAQLHVRGRILSIFNRLIDHMYETQQASNATQEFHPVSFEQSSDPESLIRALDKYESNATPILPQRLMRELGIRFPPTTRFLADTGNSVVWAAHYLHFADRRRGERRLGGGNRKRSLGRRKTTGGWLRVNMNFAPMGWAIGGAVGTAAGNPHVPVVCITGDGSILMNGQEISTAVAERLTVIYVVLNDSAFGMVKHGQRLAGAERIAFELPVTDFAAMARAMGAEGFTIRSPEDMDALDIDAICSRKGPTLLDVHIDSEEVPPMGLRMRILKAAE